MDVEAMQAGLPTTPKGIVDGCVLLEAAASQLAVMAVQATQKDSEAGPDIGAGELAALQQVLRRVRLNAAMVEARCFRSHQESLRATMGAA